MTATFRPFLKIVPILALATLCHAQRPSKPVPPLPDLTRELVEDVSHTYHLGPTGARGWIYKIGSYATPDDFEEYFCTGKSRQILITAVQQGSPADGVLAPGDVVLGIGEKPFERDARRAFGDAIDEAEREENMGKLQLLRWRPNVLDEPDAKTRGEGETETVTLPLRVMGSFSATAPYDCAKSELIVAETTKKILEVRGRDNLHIGALGLLATGDEEAVAAVREFIKTSPIASSELKLTVETPRGMASWDWSYAALLLGEYHLLTGDKDVLPALEQYVVNIAKGQAICGAWGHKMADLEYNNGQSNGRLTGYGTLNHPSLTCLLALVVGEKCGIKHPEITRAIKRAGDFFGYFEGKGCIPYGHGQPLEYMLANNGMSGMAALAFAHNGETDRGRYFARLSAAAHGKTEIGHTGTYFGAMWTPLGANVAGPDACAEFFKEHRWLQTLARKWDGGFAYQPPGGRWGGSSDRYYNLSSDGAYLLFYAAPRQKLLITGRDADRSIWLRGEEAAEAVRAGLIDYAALEDEKLMELLGHPVPMVRRKAADVLGKRDGEHVRKLISILENGTAEERIGACHAIGASGSKGIGAAPALLALIGNADADLWLRSRALSALRSLGPPSAPTVSALMGIALVEKPTDPRSDLDLEIAITLGRLINDPYEMEIDFEVFHAVANQFLGHPHHAARNQAMRLLSNIPVEHVHAVSDRLVEVILNENPDYETYHHDAARAGGLAIMQRLGIRDGLDLAMATLEPKSWGQQNRIYGRNGRLALIASYGANAKEVLPKLKAMREAGQLTDAADGRLARIERAGRSRELISLEEAVRIGRKTLE